MKRRREHGECDTREGGRGCLVFGTKICIYRKKPLTHMERAKKWGMGLMNRNVVLRWILAAAIGAMLAFSFMWMRGRGLAIEA
jgi:hypothetical protein